MSAQGVGELLLPDQGRRFLNLVFDHFSRTGDWPVIARLQRDLVLKGDRSVLRQAAAQIPRELGYQVMSGSADSFQLTIRGVVAVAPRSQEVVDFETAMRLCYKLYLDEEKPQLTSSMLREREGMSG